MIFFPERSFIDICAQHTVTGKSVHIHHSAIPPSIYNYNQCSCSISPDVCNTTATLKFRAVDVRLHSRDNLSMCQQGSRIELIGQREKKMYSCEKGKYLHGFEDFHVSGENNIMLYMHKLHRIYPAKVWLEVQGIVLFNDNHAETVVVVLFCWVLNEQKSKLYGTYFLCSHLNQ